MKINRISKLADPFSIEIRLFGSSRAEERRVELDCNHWYFIPDSGIQRSIELISALEIFYESSRAVD